MLINLKKLNPCLTHWFCNCSSFQRGNIGLDEEVLKTSFVFVFKRGLQDVLIKTNIFALVIHLQKTSSRRNHDVLIKTNIFILVICLQEVFQMFSRCLQDVLLRGLQGVFKTSCKNVF